ncbi:MAG: hypothetical protein ABSG15_08975 [FCB group bacterium]|jgi:hypothetical protein
MNLNEIHKKVIFSFQKDFHLQLDPYVKDFAQIEIKIIEEYFNLSKSCYGRNIKYSREWTKGENRFLTNIGNEEDYLVFPQEYYGTFKGGWLFDVVWVEAEKTDNETLMYEKADIKQPYNWKKTKRLVLACESEWHTAENEILSDFFKLTFASADLRLFVYTNPVRKLPHAKNHPSELCKDICPQDRNFNYLLIGVPNSIKNNLQVDKFII